MKINGQNKHKIDLFFIKTLNINIININDIYNKNPEIRICTRITSYARRWHAGTQQSLSSINTFWAKYSSADSAHENLDLYAGHMICEEVARCDAAFSEQGIGSVESAHENQDLYAGHMICEEVARSNAAFSNCVMAADSAYENQDLYAGHMICEEVARSIVRSLGCVWVAESAHENQDLYAGHMLCEEVARFNAAFSEYINCFWVVSGLRPGCEQCARKSGFVRGSHDMRRGGTLQGIGSVECANENQDLYAGHMICEEVARFNAAFSEYISCFWVVSGLRPGCEQCARKSGFYKLLLGCVWVADSAHGNQDLYAAHMIYEEVARCNAAFSKYWFRGQCASHMMYEEVARGITSCSII
ncbi:LOW QUALITY PROTEIN: hypothetical protein V1477_016358 [Vespula maculifrons]|uniref:Uncharacterized protein n=1 Tax=Vespula maculifrons TaxID=7453 RepID=A0ABD2BCT1_VESMC